MADVIYSKGIGLIKRQFALRDSQITREGVLNNNILKMTPSRIKTTANQEIKQIFNVILNNGQARFNVTRASTAVLVNNEYSEKTIGETLETSLKNFPNAAYVVLVIQGENYSKEAMVYSVKEIKAIANSIY